MAFKDVLLQLTSYPEPTPLAAVEQAVGLARALDAHVSALTFEIIVRFPGTVLAPGLVSVSNLVAAERNKSITNAHALLEAFEAAAKRAGLAYNRVVELCENAQVADRAVEFARLSDLAMIPLGEDGGFPQHIAEAIIFGAGRPALVFPAAAPASPTNLDTIGIAWDFSRTAARAVADALPLLQRAKSVRVLTIAGEKPIPPKHSAAELARHLAFHGITVATDAESAAGRPVGTVLADYAKNHRLDLLVMGAYGHTRLREFVLGGATQSILAHPPLPVLLAH